MKNFLFIETPIQSGRDGREKCDEEGENVLPNTNLREDRAGKLSELNVYLASPPLKVVCV